MRRACSVGVAIFVLLAGVALAEATDRPRPDEVVARFFGEPARALSASGIDYTLFAHALVAYVLKEALPEAGDEYDEYDGSTSLPVLPPAGAHAAWPRSRFGANCLTVLGQIRSQVFPLIEAPSLGGASALLAPSAVLLGTTVLAARELWWPLRNHIDGTRAGFALDPKVSSRKLGLALTYRW